MGTFDESAEIKSRKAVLLANANVQRANLAVALHDLRMDLMPPRPAGGSGATGKSPGMVAAGLVAVGVPLLGPRRLSRWLRMASVGLSAARFVRNWTKPGRY